jgi:hypothetical protein
MNEILLENYNIKIIDFNDYLDEIGYQCINELYDCGLIENNTVNLNKPVVKRIFYHNTIHYICEQVLYNKNKIAISFPSTFKRDQELYNYCNEEQLNKIIRTIMKKIEKMLPVLIIFQEKALDFGFLKDKIIRDEGEGSEYVLLLLEFADKIGNRNYTFEKIKKFSNKYGLNFLSYKYFNELKTKQLLFN